MTIRRLTARDLSAFRALWVEGLRQVPNAFLLDAEEVRAIPNKEIERGLEAHVYLGAFDDAERLVGFVVARRGGPLRLRHTADIGPLYIHESAQGQGLGRELMETLLRHLTEAGLLQAELVVDVENARAQVLYNSLGFLVFGRRPRSVLIDGVPRDDYLMIRALDGADLRPDA